jgi:seryl-tRNA synthetase
MLDIQFIRENADFVAEKSQQKGYDVDIQQLLGFDAERRELLQQVEDLRRQRNETAGQSKGGKPTDAQVEQGKQLKEKTTDLEHKLASIDAEFNELLKKVPNMPTDDVPVGASEEENVVAKEVGDKPKFDFKPKTHWELAETKGWIDKERAAKVTGARFAYLKGDLVKLHFALMNYGLSTLTDETKLKEIADKSGLKVSAKAFTPVLPPLLIRTEIYDAMDRLEPRDDRYKLEGEDLWLQGSAEHVIGSMHADEILAGSDLPLRYVGYATSFRKEAGSYGKDLEGIVRMHQFEKLEMESLTSPNSSLDEHYFLIAIQEYLMQQLDLPYRVMQKCTADIGKPNARGIDLDVWLPGQGKYRETHTADYMTDYQARRLKTRLRKDDGSTELVHTNDATAFSQRPLIGIIENFQTKDGNVTVPEVLRPFMGGRAEI